MKTRLLSISLLAVTLSSANAVTVTWSAANRQELYSVKDIVIPVGDSLRLRGSAGSTQTFDANGASSGGGSTITTRDLEWGWSGDVIDVYISTGVIVNATRKAYTRKDESIATSLTINGTLTTAAEFSLGEVATSINGTVDISSTGSLDVGGALNLGNGGVADTSLFAITVNGGSLSADSYNPGAASTITLLNGGTFTVGGDQTAGGNAYGANLLGVDTADYDEGSNTTTFTGPAGPAGPELAIQIEDDGSGGTQANFQWPTVDTVTDTLRYSDDLETWFDFDPAVEVTGDGNPADVDLPLDLGTNPDRFYRVERP